MEIRNNYQMNNTSFGMAFKKPCPEDMEKFTAYVTKGVKAKWVERGLKQLQAKHASDVHFDFSYHADGDMICITPKSEKAIEMFPERLALPNEYSPNSFDRACNRFQEESAASSGCSKLKQIYVGAKGVFNMLKAGLKVLFVDKTEALPANMREASVEIRNREAKIEKQLAKEKLINNALK